MLESEYQKTFVLLKPEAIQRSLVGTLIQRLEDKGLKLTAIWMHQLTKEQAEQLYLNLTSWKGYEAYIAHIISGPCIAMIWEGREAISSVRMLIGPNFPWRAGPDTIRGQYVTDTQRNLIHASDSLENAEREINLWRFYRVQWDRLNQSAFDHEEPK